MTPNRRILDRLRLCPGHVTALHALFMRHFSALLLLVKFYSRGLDDFGGITPGWSKLPT